MITKILSRNKQVLYILDNKDSDYTVVKNNKYQTVGYIKNGKTYTKNGKVICNSEAPGLLFPELGINLQENSGIIKK